MNSQIQIIVIGGLNTDLIGYKVDDIIGPGEMTFGEELIIGPGGKSRNAAQMMAAYLGKGKVAMIGKTSRDPFNLWEVPVNALNKAGVNTDYISIVNYKKTQKYPGVALIAVNKKGENQIYLMPGINNDFSREDLDKAENLFNTVKKNQGVFALSLELPLETAIYGINKAASFGIRVVLDPGGLVKGTDYSELLKQDIYIIKPNQNEAELLSGIKVTNLKSAKKSAGYFFNLGIKNVFITHGKHGGYLITEQDMMHIPVPDIVKSDQLDETGCGDQVTAILTAELSQGKSIPQAARTSILAGTLQFNRIGIKPVSRKEIERYG